MNYTAFMIENWPLVAVFIVIVILIFRLELQQSSLAITPQEMTLLMNHEHYLVIDIRDEAAFKEEHILGSKNIKPEFPDKNNPWLKYKKKKLVIVCSNGKSSNLFADKLIKKIDNKNIKILRGGIDGWKSENFPLAC